VKFPEFARLATVDSAARSAWLAISKPRPVTVW